MKKKLICTDRDKATHNASKRVTWDADKTSNRQTIAGRVKTVSVKPSEHRTSSKQHKILLSYKKKKKKEMIHQLFAAGKSTKGQAVISLPECEKNGNFACTGKH